MQTANTNLRCEYVTRAKWILWTTIMDHTLKIFDWYIYITKKIFVRGCCGQYSKIHVVHVYREFHIKVFKVNIYPTKHASNLWAVNLKLYQLEPCWLPMSGISIYRDPCLYIHWWEFITNLFWWCHHPRQESAELIWRSPVCDIRICCCLFCRVTHWFHPVYVPHGQAKSLSQRGVITLQNHENLRATWKYRCHTCKILQWRHNERDGVSNHQPHECLLNRLFKAQIKENIKAPRHWPLCGEFTAQRASVAENVSTRWHHHEHCWNCC